MSKCLRSSEPTVSAQQADCCCCCLRENQAGWKSPLPSVSLPWQGCQLHGPVSLETVGANDEEPWECAFQTDMACLRWKGEREGCQGEPAWVYSAVLGPQVVTDLDTCPCWLSHLLCGGTVRLQEPVAMSKLAVEGGVTMGVGTSRESSSEGAGLH